MADMTPAELAKFYGRKGYRPQSVLKRAIGVVGANAGTGPTGGGFNNIPAIIAAFPEIAADIVIESTEEFVAMAQARAPRGPTGELSTEAKITYRDSKGGVMARVDFTATSEVRGQDKHLYAWYVEVGARRRPAQPFVVPSIMDERRLFHGRLRDLESRLPR